MVRLEAYVLNILLFCLGVLIGISLNYLSYKNKVLEVLDHLKEVTKTIDEEQYNYFVKKFINKQKSIFVKLVETIIKKRKEKKESVDIG